MGGLLAKWSLSHSSSPGVSILALMTALFLPESLPSQVRQQDGESKAIDLRLLVEASSVRWDRCW
jgi:hypothetical protein